MPEVNPQFVADRLRWRYAVKKFDPERKIPAPVWQVLEQVLVLTPSSFGMQPWKFFVVVDPAIKAQLPAFSWGQRQPADCSHMVVLALRVNLSERDIDRLVRRTAEVRGQALESLAGLRQMLTENLINPPFDINEWAARQVYIALGQFMTAAAIMGVDTCPMEGIDGPKYDELLGIANQGYRTVVGCAAGYRAADDRCASLPKVRFPLEEVVQVV